MAISTTWSVSNMVRNESDGGVVTVYWSFVATDGTYSATEGGKLRLTPDASADDFVAYAETHRGNCTRLGIRQSCRRRRNSY